MVVMPLPKPVVGTQMQQNVLPSDRQHGRIGKWQNDTPDIVLRKARVLVRKIEQQCVNICGGHGDYILWLKCGMALHSIDPNEGYDMWKRVSRYRPPDVNHGHRESDFVAPWRSFGGYKGEDPVTCNSFFSLCKKSGVTLSREDMKEIYGE